MNVDGMLPFKNVVADYIRETGNHVLYRVISIYKDYELLARGLQTETFPAEDDGDGICYDVYIYNNQLGIDIDYAAGENKLAE